MSGTSRDIALGSEIDGLFATVCGNELYVLVTGNLGRWHLSVLEPGGVGIPLRYGAVP